ncbi:uncharacterized protein TNCV_4416551 [Trichonephila clavipes]|uniref:Reverse transcriptase domain-containing protein n=1 Tax=Trichonephila clavipes TaxID=2585209 RepID=A0A8X6S1A8_TRICX|nr:uncharacterized protein TNCV_4416551 [Trichonephila clavipes]
MSIGKFKKDELRSIADELKLVVPDNAKVLDLRELIQESEIYKNDKETYQAIVDCVLEEINDKRNENENRLEIEKIKLSHVKTCCAKNCFCGKPHNRLIHFPKPDKESIALNQTVQRSVLNTLADVFGGPGGSNCVVPPQGENEENKSFVATSFLKNKTRTVLLSSVQCFLRDKYGLLHENYLDEGIIEKVTNPFIPTNNPVFYLPHQVIIKNESLTTKLRLVFDASAHEEKQLSLNDCLFHGVNLNPNILDVLISFRSNKIAVLADVEKAFLHISLAPKDRDVVRFLIDDSENGVKVYRFNRVLFGVNKSPFLLAATIKTHIGKYMEKYPDTVRTLDHCFYVDDLVTGDDNAKSAFDLSSKEAKIMSEAGMNLRKWISND